jgi:hypothetical protein
MELLSGLQDHVQRRKIKVPNNWHSSPTVSAKGAFKEKMETCLLTSKITKNTIVVIQMHILSS